MQFTKFKNKKVLVAGGTGLVGQQLIRILLDSGAIVRIASLDDPKILNLDNIEFIRTNLSILENCRSVCQDQDIVFSLLGATGSPKTNSENPGTFMYANLVTSLNILEGARLNNVKEFLYTSTYGVYANNQKMTETEMWNNSPSENDRYAGYAKRMGELQVEAYQKQYNWNKIYIVRPANIYGPYANFDNVNSMVIPSLIKKFLSGDKVIEIWGDGSPVRDFIYSHDVASMMMSVVEKEILYPINLGSGKGTSIKDLVNVILNSKYIKDKPQITFNTDKPNGDQIRVLNTDYALRKGIHPSINLNLGIDKTIEWYLDNKNKHNMKYNAFEN